MAKKTTKKQRKSLKDLRQKLSAYSDKQLRALADTTGCVHFDNPDLADPSLKGLYIAHVETEMPRFLDPAGYLKNEFEKIGATVVDRQE